MAVKSTLALELEGWDNAKRDILIEKLLRLDSTEKIKNTLCFAKIFRVKTKIMENF
ncbi:MAG: hypothetical protein WC069_04325 [Candidatus Shapirobacteria bacterium]